MCDITTVNDIANMTATEINKMSRDTAHQTLKKVASVMKQSSQGNLNDMIAKLMQDSNENFKQLNKRLDNLAETIKDEVRKEYDPQIKSLKENGANLHTAMKKQRSFIEQLDAAQRANKLIITGIPEEHPLESAATTDEEKCALIFRKIGCTPDIHDVCRLGKKREQGDTCRPVKVTLVKPSERQHILESAPQLASHISPFDQMRIKRDTHPAVRAEWTRLHEVLKKEKVGNHGLTVAMDYKKREVTRNGTPIDSFIDPFM